MGRKLQVVPSFTVYIYWYSDTMLKAMPKNALETLKKNIVAIKKLVLTSDRSNRSDKNLTKIITKFHDYIGEEHTYRIPLRFYGR